MHPCCECQSHSILWTIIILNNSWSAFTATCSNGGSAVWTEVTGMFLIGRDGQYTSVSLSACKSLCLQDPLCLSIDYIPSTQSCDIQYTTSAVSPDNYFADSMINYYQYVCTVQTGQHSMYYLFIFNLPIFWSQLFRIRSRFANVQSEGYSCAKQACVIFNIDLLSTS